jgi:hypothetical protein
MPLRDLDAMQAVPLESLHLEYGERQGVSEIVAG